MLALQLFHLEFSAQFRNIESSVDSWENHQHRTFDIYSIVQYEIVFDALQYRIVLKKYHSFYKYYFCVDKIQLVAIDRVYAVEVI